MKKLLATAVTSVALAVAALNPIGSDPLLLDGCIVRFPTTAGPVVLDDDSHDCSPRVTGVHLDANGNLHIAYTPISQVVSASITPDDFLNRNGVSTGASVGLTETIVNFYRSGVPVRGDSGYVVGSTSNIFVLWLSMPSEAS